MHNLLIIQVCICYSIENELGKVYNIQNKLKSL